LCQGTGWQVSSFERSNPGFLSLFEAELLYWCFQSNFPKLTSRLSQTISSFSIGQDQDQISVNGPTLTQERQVEEKKEGDVTALETPGFWSKGRPQKARNLGVQECL
jgi:hypothetical protein